MEAPDVKTEESVPSGGMLALAAGTIHHDGDTNVVVKVIKVMKVIPTFFG